MVLVAMGFLLKISRVRVSEPRIATKNHAKIRIFSRPAKILVFFNDRRIYS